MNRGDLLIRITIWIALLGYLAGAAYAIARGGARWERAARTVWTASCVLLFAHVGFALHFAHGWSQTSVYAETARQTAEVFGANWGGGMFINYGLMLVWLAEVVWWWAAPASYRRRPRWLVVAWQGFLLFIFFNATVVFVAGPLRWLGLGGCAGLLLLFLRRPRE
ncbi:MAG: hypothetical protein SF339_08335 [Blastocatellia bacterium]|nr:hypothetical protein [Blastocatellia bacterium]